MGQRRAITGLVAWVVALLTIGVVVVQDATAQETPPKDAQGYINRGIAYFNKGDSDRAIADSRPSTNVATAGSEGGSRFDEYFRYPPTPSGEYYWPPLQWRTPFGRSQ
jgi:hypothetical protein